MQEAISPGGLMTIDQFCRKHSISRSTFYRIEGLKRTKVGASTRIAPAHEREWLAGLPIEANDAA